MVPNNGIPFENEVVPSIGSTNQQNSLLFSLPKISSVTISASVLDKILYISFSTFKSYSVSKLPSSLRLLSEISISLVISFAMSNASIAEVRNISSWLSNLRFFVIRIFFNTNKCYQKLE